MKLSVMMPCYMEADNLKNILPKIDEALRSLEIESEILVVDTMDQMDDTLNICNGLSSILSSQLHYVARRNGNNYGDAIRTGIEDSKGQYVVVMDADGSHDPKDIVRLYNEIISRKCDVVIGSRYIKGGDTNNPIALKLMSYALNICYRMLFHLNVRDVSDSYRIYNAGKLKSIRLQCNNFDIVEEILIKLKYHYPQIDICEIPIYFNKRAYGESKRDLGKFILSYLATIRRLKRIQKGKT